MATQALDHGGAAFEVRRANPHPPPGVNGKVLAPYLVQEAPPLRRPGDDDDAAIPWIDPTPDEMGPLQSIEQVGHPAPTDSQARRQRLDRDFRFLGELLEATKITAPELEFRCELTLNPP
ncbi:MAG: hypothetical protein Kow00109_05100 [Acidobacteriota bacterium]